MSSRLLVLRLHFCAFHFKYQVERREAVEFCFLSWAVDCSEVWILSINVVWFVWHHIVDL